MLIKPQRRRPGRGRFLTDETQKRNTASLWAPSGLWDGVSPDSCHSPESVVGEAWWSEGMDDRTGFLVRWWIWWKGPVFSSQNLPRPPWAVKGMCRHPRVRWGATGKGLLVLATEQTEPIAQADQHVQERGGNCSQIAEDHRAPSKENIQWSHDLAATTSEAVGDHRRQERPWQQNRCRPREQPSEGEVTPRPLPPPHQEDTYPDTPSCHPGKEDRGGGSLRASIYLKGLSWTETVLPEGLALAWMDMSLWAGG